MATYFITGCSRAKGIGLELVRQLASRPVDSVKTIIATTRDKSLGPDAPLQALINSNPDRVHHVQLEMTDKDSIAEAVTAVSKIVASGGLDVLINNAGVQRWEPPGVRGMETLEEVLGTNVVAVHNVTAAFLPLLQQSRQKKIINISSTVGSIGLRHLFAQVPVASYKVSKAALNMLTMQWAIDLEKEGFTVIALSPGWLKTDLGGEIADLEVEDGARATLKIVDEVSSPDNGSFRNIHIPGHPNYDGSNPPW